MSEYGKATAYKMSYELAAAGVCVVSGMALGIDGVCACGALESTGETVAVLGCGVSIAYPKEHAKLMKHIAKRGAIISEYPPFEKPQGHNFPKRNRIISGLCQGVVVIEGAKGSGALITATRAISQGRELFAVPGNIGQSNSDGPNELIRSGANVALCANDIIEHYDFLYHDMINYAQLSAARKRSELDERALKYHGVCARGGIRATVKQSIETQDVAVPEHQPKAEPTTQEITQKEQAQSKIYDTLDECTRKVYDMIPDEGQFSADTVVARGVSSSEAITALTMLEISGLIASMPGGTFRKI
jgi:DNA protecting protein DprA